MEEETRRSLRELAYFSSIGLSVALSIFIGLAIGLWLDLTCFSISISVSGAAREWSVSAMGVVYARRRRGYDPRSRCEVDDRARCEGGP